MIVELGKMLAGRWR